MIKHKWYRFIWQGVALAALLAGCSNSKSPSSNYSQSESAEISETIRKWIGKQLILPTDVGYFTTNVDSVNAAFPTEEFKIVRYVGQGICSACRLRLHFYPTLLAEMSERVGREVGFVCIVNSADMKELRRTLRRENRHGLTMWIDEADSLNRLNGFPEIGALQTFLVDGENRVLAIGDPAVNPRVMQLFVDVLRSDSIRERGRQREALTQLVADAEERELGTVAAGDTARCRFVVRNVGEVDFVAEGVVSSCDCTRGRLSADTIRPGGEATLEVEFSEAEAVGDFVRTVSVFGNTPRELTVEISGTVKGRKS